MMGVSVQYTTIVFDREMNNISIALLRKYGVEHIKYLFHAAYRSICKLQYVILHLYYNLYFVYLTMKNRHFSWRHREL